jgi:hypothetical protein
VDHGLSAADDAKVETNPNLKPLHGNLSFGDCRGRAATCCVSLVNGEKLKSEKQKGRSSWFPTLRAEKHGVENGAPFIYY